MEVSPPQDRREINPRRRFSFFGARLHNLKGVDVDIPLGMLTVVTGVSGSGKSTLVHDIMYRALQARLRQPRARRGDGRRWRSGARSPPPDLHPHGGADPIQDVVMIDQTPIGRTPRSNPVTYIKALRH